jgi:hypothetical protein
VGTYPNLEFVNPADIQPAVDGTNRMSVVEKRGIIRVFEADYYAAQKTLFLDLPAGGWRHRVGGHAHGFGPVGCLIDTRGRPASSFNQHRRPRNWLFPEAGE